MCFHPEWRITNDERSNTVLSLHWFSITGCIPLSPHCWLIQEWLANEIKMFPRLPWAKQEGQSLLRNYLDGWWHKFLRNHDFWEIQIPIGLGWCVSDRFGCAMFPSMVEQQFTVRSHVWSFCWGASRCLVKTAKLEGIPHEAKLREEIKERKKSLPIIYLK